MAKKCVIDNCEENAFGFYPLCKKHLEQTKTGQVYKDDTGKWRERIVACKRKMLFTMKNRAETSVYFAASRFRQIINSARIAIITYRIVWRSSIKISTRKN